MSRSGSMTVGSDPKPDPGLINIRVTRRIAMKADVRVILNTPLYKPLCLQDIRGHCGKPASLSFVQEDA
jgi:hypothetical protein